MCEMTKKRWRLEPEWLPQRITRDAVLERNASAKQRLDASSDSGDARLVLSHESRLSLSVHRRGWVTHRQADQPLPEGDDNGVRPVVERQLPHRIRQVVLDGLFGNIKRHTDLTIAQAERGVLQNLPLALRQHAAWIDAGSRHGSLRLPPEADLAIGRSVKHTPISARLPTGLSTMLDGHHRVVDSRSLIAGADADPSAADGGDLGCVRWRREPARDVGDTCAGSGAVGADDELRRLDTGRPMETRAVIPVGFRLPRSLSLANR